jgi:hypothetical protein
VIIKNLKTSVQGIENADWGEETNDTVYVCLNAKIETFDMADARRFARDFEKWIVNRSREGKELAPKQLGLNVEAVLQAIDNKTLVKYWPLKKTWCYPRIGTIKYYGDYKVEFVNREGDFEASVHIWDLEIFVDDEPALPEEVTP